MPKNSKTETPLCTLHQTKELKVELYREGEGFRVHFAGKKRKDRKFESLPALLQGLHGLFLEIRMSGGGIHGLAGLAKTSDSAREDVLAASRKIHAALDAK